MGESRDDAANAELIRRWLILALLNGVFSGSSDSTLHKMRDALKKHGEHGRPFPIRELDEAARESRRIASSDPAAIDNLLKLRYGDPSTFLRRPTCTFECVTPASAFQRNSNRQSSRHSDKPTAA